MRAYVCVVGSDLVLRVWEVSGYVYLSFVILFWSWKNVCYLGLDQAAFQVSAQDVY